MRIDREIASFMEANGYRLVRSTGHNVWSNGTHTVVTSRSPSCHRVLKNIKRDVLGRQRKAAG